MDTAVRDFLAVVSSSHEYVMLVNAVCCTAVLLRRRKTLMNFYVLGGETDVASAVACLFLPMFYAFEAVLALKMCATFYFSACKYAIHHLLTNSVFGLMFQHDLLTGPSFLVQATHGFMNFFYYHNELLTYLFCRWYVAATIFCGVHMAYHFLGPRTPQKHRLVLAMAFTLMAAIGANNSQTEELTALCELSPKGGSLERDLKVWGSHLLAAGALAYCLYQNTRQVLGLPLSLRDIPAKYY